MIFLGSRALLNPGSANGAHVNLRSHTLRSFSGFSLLLTILLVGQAIAQEPPAKAERAKLQFLVGNFTTEVTIPAGPSAPNGAQGKGTSAVTYALDSIVPLPGRPFEQTALPVWQLTH